MQRSYLGQADRAQKAALSQGNKIADLSKKFAAIAHDQSRYGKDLDRALKTEGAAQQRAADKARKDRESAERKLSQNRRAEERRRRQERQAEEPRRHEERIRSETTRREDQAAAAAMVSQSEQRLSRRIEAIRSFKSEQLRILPR